MTALLDLVPNDWGPKAGGNGAAATLTRRGADAIQFQANAHLAVILLTPQPSRVAALGSDRRSAFSAPVGSLELIPAEADFFGEWSTPKENILVGLAPGRLAEAAYGEFGRGGFELFPPPPAQPDPHALQMAQLLREEILRKERASRLYIDSLLTMLSIHILREYSSLGENAGTRGRRVARGGLAPGTWRLIRDYVQEHLAEALTLQELAGIAGLSASHFLRAFRETVGQPPHRYVRELRVERAEQMIAESDLPLKAIAQVTGFASASHLISTMRKLRSVTPGAIRRAKISANVAARRRSTGD